jgi:hypothetical protein
MATINDIIRSVLPEGTRPGPGLRNWQHPPIWPPDLFAVAATLATLSGCYGSRRYTAHWIPDCVFDGAYLRQVRKAGSEWGEGILPPEVARLWKALITSGSAHVERPRHKWKDAVMKLLAIADEACAGIGFVSTTHKNSALADYFFSSTGI